MAFPSHEHGLKRAKKSRSEIRFEAVLAASAITENGIAVFSACRYSPLLRVEYANEHIAARLGVPNEQLYDPQTIFGSGRNPQFLRTLLERAERGDERQFQVEIARPDGASYWISVACVAVDPDEHGCLRFVAVTTDITEHKDNLAMRQLLASSVEEEPDAVVILRMNQGNLLYPEFVYVNGGFCEVTGYSRDDLANGAYPILLGPRSDRHEVAKCAMRVLDGEPVVSEVVLYRKDGSAYWAEVRAHMLEGRGDHCVLIVRDISDRRAREQHIALLSRAIEEASDFVIVTDSTPPSKGGPFIVYVNRAFCEATGFTEADLLGRQNTTIYSERNDPKLMTAIGENIERGDVNYREALIVRKDGSDFWIEFVAKPFKGTDETATYRLSIGRDITLRKRSLNQVALMLGAMESSQDRIVLYEVGSDGTLKVGYENDAASESGKCRLSEIWNRETAKAADLRQRLEAGQEVRQIFADQGPNGTPLVVEFSARAVQGMNRRLESVLTIERVLADVSKNGTRAGLRSRIAGLTSALPALAEVGTSQERLDVLEAILAQTFGATIAANDCAADADRLRVDAIARRAYFSFAGKDHVVSWPEKLEESSLTALRFCIEAAIEEDSHELSQRV